MRKEKLYQNIVTKKYLLQSRVASFAIMCQLKQITDYFITLFCIVQWSLKADGPLKAVFLSILDPLLFFLLLLLQSPPHRQAPLQKQLQWQGDLQIG